MKILWNSSVIFGNSGYGVASREIIKRLQADGHEVALATKHQFFGRLQWEGIEIYEGINSKYIANVLEREKFDYLISFWDIWLMSGRRHFPHDKWVAYCPIDTEWIADRYRDVLLGKDSDIPSNKGPSVVIAMSKHGVRELRSIGLDPLYVPLGVNTEMFKPDKEARAGFRKSFGWADDVFVIGSVGLNYKDDRKGFIELMIAFNELRKKHSDVRLYLHTHAEGIRDNSLNYANIMNLVDEALDEYILFGPQEAIDLNTISQERLNIIYNTFDVMCLPTKGEGFGMPIIESAAAGVPVITTATTTGPEFHEAGMAPWLIDVDHIDNKEWMPTGTWRLRARPRAILETLEKAYNAWKFEDYRVIKEGIRKASLAYDWELVWSKYWRSIFNILQENKSDLKESPHV